MILRIWNYLKESSWMFITILFPILVGIDVIDEFLDKSVCRWVLAIGLFLTANILSFKKFESKQKLYEDITGLENTRDTLINNLESVPVGMIKILAKNFKIGNDSRITLYRVSPEETFIPVARYSDSPLYRKLGRNEYPIDSGYIGKCWKDGKAVKERLADYTNNPNRYVQEALKQGGITESEIHGLLMKSRSFYCKRLDYNGDEPIAVLVYESMKTTLPANIDDLNKFLEGPFGKVLIDTVQLNLTSVQGGVNSGQS